MSTSIGVFASRQQAENAVRELLSAHVPESAISLLTAETSEGEHRHTGRKVGAYVGGAIGTGTGLSLGLAAATLAVPGIGPVLALGLGAAALLGFGGIKAGKSVGDGLDLLNEEERRAAHLPEASFFCNVLAQGRSVIVVQSDNAKTHAAASGVLDRLGLKSASNEPPKATKVSQRMVGDVLVISLAGRVVIGGAADEFRALAEDAIEDGARKVLVNMAEVSYLDSSGMGALVNAAIRIRKLGGELKLAQLSANIRELLELTRLDKVMEIAPDEKQALAAFG